MTRKQLDIIWNANKRNCSVVAEQAMQVSSILPETAARLLGNDGSKLLTAIQKLSFYHGAAAALAMVEQCEAQAEALLLKEELL